MEKNNSDKINIIKKVMAGIFLIIAIIAGVSIVYFRDCSYSGYEEFGELIIMYISITAFIVMICMKNESIAKRIIKALGIGLICSIIIIFGILIYNQSSRVIHNDKPIIYLYPTEDKEVSVNLKYSDNITVSYPKYTTGWKVLAMPDGNLTDIATNKKLYSLYYECINKEKFKVEKEGFVVKGEDVATFLEEKLAALGLNEREAEEFIIYWLPKLEKNKYNYIRFATNDEINKNMPLEINPNPDITIRVLMTYKGLNRPIEVINQELETPKREGFVAVEWGGTEIQ